MKFGDKIYLLHKGIEGWEIKKGFYTYGTEDKIWISFGQVSMCFPRNLMNEKIFYRLLDAKRQLKKYKKKTIDY